MSRIGDLTPEQEALLDVVAKEYIDDLTAEKGAPDAATVERWMDRVYGFFDKKRPNRIEIVASPYAALTLGSELVGAPLTSTNYCGIGESGWIAFYDYFARIDVLRPGDTGLSDLIALRDFVRCAWDTLLLDECAIIVRRPTATRVDDAGNLHCSTGPCIEWADGEKDFAWHGTWVDERVIINPRSYTREEYLAITNTETRRALSESGGWQWVAELIGARVVDTWTDDATSLRYELLECNDGQKLLRKQSPRLKDESQPVYMEPVHEDLRTARAARKWQAVPSWTPDQCERNPELRYRFET